MVTDAQVITMSWFQLYTLTVTVGILVLSWVFGIIFCLMESWKPAMFCAVFGVLLLYNDGAGRVSKL